MLNISINELHKRQIEKKNMELEHFGQILKLCCEHIKITANSDATSCFFQLPTFVFGIPLYDFERCANYIIHNLKTEGFMIVFIKPNTLYISWDIRFTSRDSFVPVSQPLSLPMNVHTNSQLPSNNINQNQYYPSNIRQIENNNINNKSVKNYNKIDDYKPSGNFIGSNYM